MQPSLCMLTQSLLMTVKASGEMPGVCCPLRPSPCRDWFSWFTFLNIFAEYEVNHANLWPLNWADISGLNRGETDKVHHKICNFLKYIYILCFHRKWPMEVFMNLEITEWSWFICAFNLGELIHTCSPTKNRKIKI